MRNMILFIQKNIRKPIVILTMGLILLGSFVGFGYTEFQENLPCAVVSEYQGPERQVILEYLERENFTICDSKEAVIRLIQQGKADCGIVFREDLKERILSGDLSECGELLISPHTCRDNTYSLVAAIALYHVYAPYRTAECIRFFGFDVTGEIMIPYFEKNYTDTNRLEFEITNIQGKEEKRVINNNFPIGLISIIMFLGMGFLSMVIVQKNREQMEKRMTKKVQFLHVVLPQNLGLGLLFSISAMIGCLGASFLWPGVTWGLFLALPIYGVLTAIVLSALDLLGMTYAQATVVISVIAVASLFICPLYWDIALMLPTLVPLRFVMVPYWLYVLIP